MSIKNCSMDIHTLPHNRRTAPRKEADMAAWSLHNPATSSQLLTQYAPDLWGDASILEVQWAL